MSVYMQDPDFLRILYSYILPQYPSCKLRINNDIISFRIIFTRGVGLLEYLYKAHIYDAATRRIIKLVIKTASSDIMLREKFSIDVLYTNEIHFFSKIYPILRAFEQKYHILESGLSVPEYFTSLNDVDKKLMAWKEFHDENFEMKRYETLDENHCNMVFATFGRFHAISFCFKRQYRQKFIDLVKSLHFILPPNLIVTPLENKFRELLETIIEVLHQDRDKNHLIQKLKVYLKNPDLICSKMINYGGNNGCLIHGHCITENMLFKYNNKTHLIEAIKLFNFYFCRYGSVVHDLSNFYYSIAKTSKQQLDHLGPYLDSYYKSFSNTVRKFNEDPNKLLPREQLLHEWKVYSKINMFLALDFIKDEYYCKTDNLSRAHDKTKLENKKILFHYYTTNMLQHMNNWKAL